MVRQVAAAKSNMVYYISLWTNVLNLSQMNIWSEAHAPFLNPAYSDGDRQKDQPFQNRYRVRTGKVDKSQKTSNRPRLCLLWYSLFTCEQYSLSQCRYTKVDNSQVLRLLHTVNNKISGNNFTSASICCH